MSKPLSLWLQSRILYLIFFAVLSVPFVIPVNIPLEVTQPTIDAYKTIESMPDGSIAFIAWDFGVMSFPELYPQALAITRHAIQKDFKFVIATFWSADGAIYARKALSEDLDLTGYEYGVDYVHLGFYPGGATPLTAFAQDIHSLVKVDIDGRPIDDMPLMQQLHDANDFDIWLVGHYSPQMWPGLIQAPYDATMVCTTDSGGFIGLLPFYLSGQIKGLLNGCRGAAEYETLLGYSGQGQIVTGVQSFSHVYLIVAIITCNIFYWRSRMSVKK